MTETIEFRLEKVSRIPTYQIKSTNFFQSLPEIQDLVDQELFTQPEVKAILRQRSQYEHALLNKRAKKIEFLNYIRYEMNLEALRQKRKKRQKSNPSPRLWFFYKND